MPIRAVTFDVYSALFDTLTGLAEALVPLLRRRGADGNARPLARVWWQKHTEYMLVATALGTGAGRGLRHRRVIEASAAQTLRTLDPVPTADELARLTAAWEHLPPWPEVAGVLPVVRARPLVLAALSNGDADMLHVLLGRLPVRFDQIISTGGSPFKPHPAVYERAVRVLDVPAGDLLHIAGSATDAMGATAAGIRTLWVNRTGDAVVEPRVAPAHQTDDLSGVLRILDEG